jgi:hypothetical protein
VLHQSTLYALLCPLIGGLTRFQVYTLEKVLKLKKDPVKQISFLDEAVSVGGRFLQTDALSR